MSHISQERLIEMEAEMDRFEQEILSQPSASDLPRVVIGSSTYNQVSAQLKMLRAASGVSVEERERKQQEVAAQLRALRESTEKGDYSARDGTGYSERDESPNDDSDDDHDYDQDKSQLVGRDEPPPSSQSSLPAGYEDLPFLPPPPPPPPVMTSSASMSFVPPQIRHRPPHAPFRPPPRMRPPPPPPRPFGGPMGPGSGNMSGHPGGMSGPGPGPFPPRPGMGFGPGGPMGPGGPGPIRGPGGNFNMMGPRPMGGGSVGVDGIFGGSSVEPHAGMEHEAADKDKGVEKPKVIYSSAPQITLPKKEKTEKTEKKKKKKKKKVDEEVAKEGSSMATDSASSTPAPSVAMETVTMPTSTFTPVDPEDDLQIADMDIDVQYLPKKEKKEKKKKFVRMAAGTTWEDPSLAEWDPDDFRLFCGDLGNEVTDETLARAFSKYPSFVKAKVLRDKRSQKTKGYGFVSFKDPNDYVRAMREMNGKLNSSIRNQTWKFSESINELELWNVFLRWELAGTTLGYVDLPEGKYVGNRPIKLRKSTWRDRNIDVVKKKDKEKKRLGLR